MSASAGSFDTEDVAVTELSSLIGANAGPQHSNSNGSNSSNSISSNNYINNNVNINNNIRSSDNSSSIDVPTRSMKPMERATEISKNDDDDDDSELLTDEDLDCLNRTGQFCDLYDALYRARLV